MVKEPVHGGMLAVLPEDCRQLLPDKNISPAGWALRFVMNLPGVSVTLSGMSETEQAEENTAAADSEHSLTRKELSRLERISEILHKKNSGSMYRMPLLLRQLSARPGYSFFAVGI